MLRNYGGGAYFRCWLEIVTVQVFLGEGFFGPLFLVLKRIYRTENPSLSTNSLYEFCLAFALNSSNRQSVRVCVAPVSNKA